MSKRRRLMSDMEEDTSKYLTFKALVRGKFTLTIGSKLTSTNLSYISYSIDYGKTWVRTNNVNSQQVVITTPYISAGGKVLWKGSGNGTASGSGISTDYISIFSSTGKFKASGNILSLIYGDSATTQTPKAGFACLFMGCSNIVTPPKLPSTTLSNTTWGYTYHSMFKNCRSLIEAPELPVKVLQGNFGYTYHSMFYGCSSLKVPPSLPATTLQSNCYQQMFMNSGITSCPDLPATSLPTYCYYGMFKGCSGIVSAGIISATRMASNCCESMFEGCTSLTTAPALIATAVNSYCYRNMFKGCTKLINVPERLPATTLQSNCYNSMFYGCTSLTSAPVLPATTLVSNCYNSMFYGCTKLGYIKAMFTTTPSTSYTKNWVSNVKSTGTFVKNSAATWNVNGVNGIPSGWTVTTASS